MELDDHVCYCFHISKRKIRNFIRIHQPRRASQVSECGGAGTGCGWCIAYIEHMFKQAEQGGEEDSLTAEEYARNRADYIRAGKGRPAAGAIPLPEEPDE